jgi:hypothetical protein
VKKYKSLKNKGEPRRNSGGEEHKECNEKCNNDYQQKKESVKLNTGYLKISHHNKKRKKEKKQ